MPPPRSPPRLTSWRSALWGSGVKPSPPSALSRASRSCHGPAGRRGAILKGEGGEIQQRGAVECSEGTTVEIADLFFNTPARLKFLKSPHTELAAALRVATQLALAQPALHLRFTHNQRSPPTAPRA